MKSRIVLTSMILMAIWLNGCIPSAENHAALLAEMEESLQTEILQPWYPKAVDRQDGGYYTNLGFDWKLQEQQPKILVNQARHLYTTSYAARFLKERAYLDYARHGFEFLRDVMWDREYGGFYAALSKEGKAIEPAIHTKKTVYGNAFAVYASVYYFLASGDSSALQTAIKSFHWLEEHSHDSEFRGYFNQMNIDGSWSEKRFYDEAHTKLTGGGLKDQNTTIHLMEAFSELYRVWPDDLLKERLAELLTLVRDTITNKKGFMTLFFERDWTPLSLKDSSETFRRTNHYFDNVSFGHDIETAYLMLEAADALGMPNDPATLAMAKKMVNHSLTKGWDPQNGGLYYEGYYLDNTDSVTIINDSKEWWVQAESMNSCLLMSRLFPDKSKYYEYFLKQWQYIKTYQIDHEHGGWYAQGWDARPEKRESNKGGAWKASYHNARAMINCIKLLRREHELAK